MRVPVPAAGAGYAYEKLKRKVGDYATAAAAVQLTMKDGVVETIAIGLTNVSETPLLAVDAMAILRGSRLQPATVDRAIAAAEAITKSRIRRARSRGVPHRHGGRDAAPGARPRRRARDGLRRGESMSKVHIKLEVNGKAHESLVEPRTLLIHFLREDLGLTGAHIGCETAAIAAACTVDIDGGTCR